MERIRGGWVNVPEHLKCMSDLKEMGLKPVGEVRAGNRKAIGGN